MMNLSPGRYGIMIPTPLVSIMTSLQDRVKETHDWMVQNGGTLERWEQRFDGVFAIAKMPKESHWPFDWGEPVRIKADVKTSRDFTGDAKFDEEVYDTAQKITSWGGAGLLLLLFLMLKGRK